MEYRIATIEDAENIAALHAISWQKAYRGSFSDDFLDNHVVENRRKIWQKRFAEKENQTTILIENEDGLVGFACIYPKNDQYGCLIDNLHVAEAYQGLGIGKNLMQKAANWVLDNTSQKLMHLWVLENNISAIEFYKKLGAKKSEQTFYTSPDGIELSVFRMVWDDSNFNFVL
jgi:GNAT superfamily N-acetyltransferase